MGRLARPWSGSLMLSRVMRPLHRRRPPSSAQPGDDRANDPPDWMEVSEFCVVVHANQHERSGVRNVEAIVPVSGRRPEPQRRSHRRGDDAGFFSNNAGANMKPTKQPSPELHAVPTFRPRQSGSSYSLQGDPNLSRLNSGTGGVEPTLRFSEANLRCSRPTSPRSKLWTLLTAPFAIWLMRLKLWRAGSKRSSEPGRIYEDEPWF